MKTNHARHALLCLVAMALNAACDFAPKMEGDYRAGRQLFRLRNDNGQVSLENWDMGSSGVGPVIVVPLAWKDGAYRGTAQLVGEMSVAQAETGILVLGAGKRWEATPLTLPPTFPQVSDSKAGTELLVGLLGEVEKQAMSGKCGDRKIPLERAKLIAAWFAAAKAESVTPTPTVQTPFLVRRDIVATFKVPAFSGPEGTVNALEFTLNGRDSLGIMSELGLDAPATLQGINGRHRPWGTLGDMFCDDYFFAKKLGAATYTNEPAPKPVKTWFR